MTHYSKEIFFSASMQMIPHLTTLLTDQNIPYSMLQLLHVHLLSSHRIWDEDSCHLQPHTQTNNNLHGSFYEYQHTVCLANKYGIVFEHSFRRLIVCI